MGAGMEDTESSKASLTFWTEVSGFTREHPATPKMQSFPVESRRIFRLMIQRMTAACQDIQTASF